jgi:uncharacterized membrane protein
MSSHHPTFTGDFRKFFVKGLAILLPTVLTIALLLYVIFFIYNRIAGPINAGVRWSVIAVAPRIAGDERMPAWYEVSRAQIDEAMSTYRPKPRSEEAAIERIRTDAFRAYWNQHWSLEAIGFIIAVVLVYLAGVLVGNFIGRRIYARVEKLFLKVPMVRQVYPSVKQVTDFVLGDNDKKQALPSNRVVLVEYPRKGIWTVGLMTGETMNAIEHVIGERCVTIFIPSSPTPFTGYTITVPAKEVYELPISMDETIRFVVSGGVLIPERQRPETPPVINRQEMRREDGLPAPDLADQPQDATMEDHDGPGDDHQRASA